MSGENAATPAATPSESTASPERAGASAPVDGGQATPEAGATPTDGQQQPSEEGQAPKPVPEHRTVQGRISEYQKRAREAELTAAEERGRRLALEDALRAGVKPREEAAPAAPPAPPAAPDPKNYTGGKFDDKYIEDFAEWKAQRAVDAEFERRDNAAKEAERTREAQAAIEQGAKRLGSSLETAVQLADGEAGDNFQNAVGVLELAFKPVREGGLPRPVVDLITESNNPVHVAEWLGRYPDELNAVRRMNATQAARYIGGLDGQITANLKRAAQPAPPARTAPQPSPAPIPVVQSTGAAPSFDPNKGSMEDFVRWRNGG